MIRYLIAGLASFILATSINVVPASAAVNDFEITQYNMQLELGRDNEKRSTLKTTETITANFTHPNQNHGIERSIPKKYDGHVVSLHVQSVTDVNGAPIEYTTYDDNNDNTIVRIGSKNAYVSGVKTYKITYTQRDVTKAYGDTTKDEFYWDLNGTDWRVPIRQFSAEITVAPELAATYTQSSCYQGKATSTTLCELQKKENRFDVNASNLGERENVTVALGFTSGTFAAYQPSFMERLLQVWFIGLVVTGILSFMALIWAITRWSSYKNRSKELGTIVPEYLPPKEASVTTAAEVLDSPHAVMAAQLIDFAVRHYLKIYETKEKSFWSSAEYTLEITKDISTLREEEQEILRDMFDGNTAVGAKLEMKTLRNSTSLQTRMKDNPEKLKALVRGSYGLREKLPDKTRWFTRLALMMLIIGLVTAMPLLLIFALVVWMLGHTLWPLTDKGLALRRYLDGLKLYIGVAETERLKILQSPQGAEKVGGVSSESPGELVKLYEKVLPYAILFGQEKDWGKQLGAYYESTGATPDWYNGANANSVFSAALLSSAISDFSTATSYTSADNSSSGGSSGGGSSGGGGGGGGGGGW